MGIYRRIPIFLLLFMYCVAFAGADEFADGKDLFELNRPREAISHFEAAMGLPYHNPDVYNFLGLAYYQVQDYEKSVAAFVAGLRVSGTDTKIIGFNGGNSAYALKDYVRADELYSLAIQSDAAFASAFLNRANARLLLGQLALSLADYEQYLTLTPDSPQNDTITALIEKIRAQLEKERLEALLEVPLMIDDFRQDNDAPPRLIDGGYAATDDTRLIEQQPAPDADSSESEQRAVEAIIRAEEEAAAQLEAQRRTEDEASLEQLRLEQDAVLRTPETTTGLQADRPAPAVNVSP